MMFHISIKFRAFGVTFGTIDQKVSGAVTLAAVIKPVLAIVAKTIPAAGLVDPGSLVSQIQVPPHVIYNDRGVLLEVVAS